MSAITPYRACQVIAKCDPKEVIEMAIWLGVDHETVKIYNAYVPSWRGTAETRGALVSMLKFIAAKGCEFQKQWDEQHRSGDA